MSDPQTPITCPACERLDLNPRYVIEHLFFELFFRNPGPARDGTLRPMYLPVLRWTCPGCGQPFIRGCCCYCGKDWMFPKNPEHGGWQLDCGTCDSQHQQQN